MHVSALLNLADTTLRCLEMLHVAVIWTCNSKQTSNIKHETHSIDKEYRMSD